MAGSIALSLTQRYDNNSHLPLDGGQLQFYAAGTTTPQSAYQDISLTIPYPNPITLDSGGNVPQLFFADGYIKFRLSNAAGVTQLAYDNVLVLGPTSGGGAAPSVDPTTIIATGDLKARYGTGVLSGFVRANGRTIGSATSGASERANSDCQSLFEYLWGADANLTVSTGRGATANADWVANKTIALPDWRGRALAFLDDMGNSAAGRLTNSMTPNGTTLGAAGGAESVTLITANLPAYTPAGALSISTSSTDEQLVNGIAVNGSVQSGSSGGFDWNNVPTKKTLASSLNGTFGSSTFTGTAQGGTSTPVNKVMPAMLATIYMKL